MGAVDFLGKIFFTFTAVFGSGYGMDAAEFVDKICSTFTAVLGSVDGMDAVGFVGKICSTFTAVAESSPRGLGRFSLSCVKSINGFTILGLPLPPCLEV